MANALDVAQCVLDELGGNVGALKLQKLLYFIQGWSLVWRSEPIFDDPIQAWTNGPVVYEVWRRYSRPHQFPNQGIGDTERVSEDERRLISAVLQAYGGLSGSALKSITHREGPWQRTRGDTPPNWGSQVAIDPEAIREHFSDTPFGPRPGQARPIDERTIDEALSGDSEALADLIEQGTGVRPREP